MASSPKTMFSGTIEVSPLVNIPITIGKAYTEEREGSLVQVNVENGKAERILKTEHLASGKKVTNKQHAVEVNGELRVLESEEFAGIERATKSHILKVLDVKPLGKLPLTFSTGCYYVRMDEKAKVDHRAFKALALALAKLNVGLICKWGNSSRQKLVVISVESGVMLLRVLPFATDIRPASKTERAHWAIEVPERYVEKMSELLGEISKNGEPWNVQQDEGLRLRREAVDRLLNGEEVTAAEPEPEPVEVDYFEMIDNAIAAVKTR
jgi:non-homologous end joining protein Ku